MTKQLQWAIVPLALLYGMPDVLNPAFVAEVF